MAKTSETIVMLIERTAACLDSDWHITVSSRCSIMTAAQLHRSSRKGSDECL